MQPATMNRSGPWRQFTLRSLFELTTVCCVLAAVSSSLGVWPTATLMLLALSLHLRLGGVGLFALIVGTLATLLPVEATADSVFGRQLAFSLATTGICGWYWLRQSPVFPHSPPDLVTAMRLRLVRQTWIIRSDRRPGIFGSNGQTKTLGRESEG